MKVVDDSQNLSHSYANGSLNNSVGTVSAQVGKLDDKLDDMADDFELSSTAGKLFYKELQMLRGDFQGLSRELRTIAEALIVIKSQDLASRMDKIEDTTIKQLEDRIQRNESFQVKILTVIGVVGTIFGLGVTAIEIYSKFWGKG